MNAILSAKSDPQIMIDQETDGGLRNYFLYVPSHLVFLDPQFPLLLVPCSPSAFFVCLRSFQFGAECLGQHEGSHQIIDLGDGNGPSTLSYFPQSTAFDLTLCPRKRNRRDTI